MSHKLSDKKEKLLFYFDIKVFNKVLESKVLFLFCFKSFIFYGIYYEIF